MSINCSVSARGSPNLPDVFEMVLGHEVIKRVEKLMALGYPCIIIDNTELRYVINQDRNCSCLTYPPNKKICERCDSHGAKIKKIAF